MITHIDKFVSGHTLRIATRDFGGDGTPILLIHGASRSLADWLPMAANLRRYHRVVAMDIRGHGLSDAGPWSIDAIIDDIRSVLDFYRLDNPSIFGHSLGGIFAHLFSARYANINSVVNFDGFCLDRSKFPGLSEDFVQDLQEKEWAAFFESRAHYSHLDISHEEDELVEKDNIPREMAKEITKRCLKNCGENSFQIAVDDQTSSGMKSFLLQPDFDMIDAILSSKCRTLIIRANRLDIHSLSDHQKLLAQSLWQGINHALDRLKDAAHVAIIKADVNHGLILEAHEEASNLSIEFLSKVK